MGGAPATEMLTVTPRGFTAHTQGLNDFEDDDSDSAFEGSEYSSSTYSSSSPYSDDTGEELLQLQAPPSQPQAPPSDAECSAALMGIAAAAALPMAAQAGGFASAVHGAGGAASDSSRALLRERDSHTPGRARCAPQPAWSCPFR